MQLIQHMTALFLCLAIWVGIRDILWHIEHDNMEGVAKWTTLTLLFGVSLLISLFA